MIMTARLQGGVRRVMQVSQIVGVRDGTYHVEHIFGYEQTGVNEEGIPKGMFYVTGYRPTCLARLLARGVCLPEDFFRKQQCQEQPRPRPGGNGQPGDQAAPRPHLGEAERRRAGGDRTRSGN